LVLALGACATPGDEAGDVEEAVGESGDPLPSWNDGSAKQAIIDFVMRTTLTGSPDFVAESERVAVFDNDGTLWSEQPLYFQGLFAFDQIRRMAVDRPEWQEEHPYSAVLSNDPAQIATLTESDFLEIVGVTHSGMTAQEFRQMAQEWLATAKHPRFDVPFTEMVYQPMLELLEYLRDSGIQTFIVSGGGVGLMRAFAEEVYGIPPDQVVGSSIEEVFEIRDGKPVIVRQPELHFLNDKAGKPVGINRFIGQRPIMAFGNSDGDLQMLQYTAGGEGATFLGLIHHDDGEREWAYDRESHLGRLDKALDEANQHGWTVVSMQDDWNRIFPFNE
jgi:phosphoserine phosphatase